MLPELEPIARDLNRNHQVLSAYVGRLSDDDWNRPPQPNQYSGRQVLAHLAGAARGMTRLMEQMAAGANPRLKPEYNNDYYNARQLEKRANASIAELMAEWEETHRALVAFMDKLQSQDLAKRGEHPIIGDATVLDVARTLSSHEWDHIQEFGRFVQGLALTKS